MESEAEENNDVVIVLKTAKDLMEALQECIDTLVYEKSKRWLTRRWLIRPYLLNRPVTGFFATNFQEMKADADLFFKYTRMDLPTFNYLLHLTTPYFNILRRRPGGIFEEERLVITLRYLASGDDIFSLAVTYRMGESTVRGVIQDTCQVIQDALLDTFLRPPTRFTWRNIAKGFQDSWNLGNCIGAIDGQHISIIAPSNSGSVYFNYKKYFSIILLGVCNHKYQFTMVDVGAFGSEGGVFNRSDIGKAFNQGLLDIPTETPALPNSNIRTPYYLVGDAAFRMTKNLMRPYPGRHLPDDKRICNYRLCRARRCIENSFGILVARWGVCNRRITFQPDEAKKIVLTCVVLHNFMMARTQTEIHDKYCPPNFVDRLNENGDLVLGHWREEVHGDSSLNSLEAPNNIQEANAVRDALKNYFLTPAGEVPWQYNYINQGRNRDNSA